MKNYKVRAYSPETGDEVALTFEATALAEALMMAERRTAGTGVWLSIPAEHYDEARAEGIPFNEADGLLLDPSCDCGRAAVAQLQWQDPVVAADQGPTLVCRWCLNAMVMARPNMVRLGFPMPAFELVAL